MIMAASKLDQIKEEIYTAIANENEGLLEAIAALKEELKAQGTKEAEFEPTRLVQNNRQGRQMMKSFFKKRGVIVKFAKTDDAE
jgi:cell division septum initiation protein DivIVA